MLLENIKAASSGERSWCDGVVEYAGMLRCCARAHALDAVRGGLGRAAALQGDNMCKHTYRPAFGGVSLAPGTIRFKSIRDQQKHWKALARLCRSILRLSRPFERRTGSRPACFQGTLRAAVRFTGLHKCGVRCWGGRGVCEVSKGSTHSCCCGFCVRVCPTALQILCAFVCGDCG